MSLRTRRDAAMAKGKRFRLGLFLALAAAILALQSPTARAETITVTHWGGQFYGLPYAVAMEKGFFKKNGVDVSGILTAAGGGTAVRNTLAGGIPFGEVSLAAAVQAINAGQKLIIIGAGAWSVADQMWLVKKDSTLKGIKDLGANISAVGSGAVDAGFSDELIYAQHKELVRPLFMVRDVLDPRMMQTVMI